MGHANSKGSPPKNTLPWVHGQVPVLNPSHCGWGTVHAEARGITIHNRGSGVCVLVCEYVCTYQIYQVI